MAFEHVGSHGRVFNGLEARAAEEDNKMRFIHNRPGGAAKKENAKASDGKVHVIHHNNGLVHDLGLAKNEVDVADGKKHVFHKNHGLVHDLGLAQKQEIKIDGDKGKKHIIHSNHGLVHDLGLAQKQEIEVDGDKGKKHIIHSNHGLVHDLGLAQKQEIEVDGDGGKKHVFHHNHGLIHDLGLAQKDAVVETVYSQVYVTESKTFDGPAQLVTMTGTTTSPAAASMNSAEAAYASAKSAANAPDVAEASSSAAPVVAAAVTSSTAAAVSSYQTTPPQFTRTQNSHLKGVPHTTSREAGPSVIGGTPLSQQHSGTNVDLSQKDSAGMTAGAKAGVAFGVIFALALCGGLIFFCWRRRKQQQDRSGAEKLDEKHASQASFFSGTAAAVGAPAGNLRGSVQSNKSHTAATAPRLSLRPVTQFLPNIMGGSSNNAESTRNGPQMSEKPKSAWERKPVGSGQNPFDDAAVIDEKNARPVSPLNPFEEGDGTAVAAAGKTSPSHSSKNSWEGSEPPTPKSTKFGTAAAVPIGAAGAAGGPKVPPPGPNNVHRVQLDFKPSMDDELELKSGQIVRMLHEYDDGWCLCIRMDRSQQGVCPRTCLSKLPVKPRAQGPPPNGPQGRPRGPPPPGMARPQSPAMRDNMVPRPLTPTGRERSQTGPRNSPAPQDGSRNRSQSVSSAGRPASPAGMPTRKPVPGQAL